MDYAQQQTYLQLQYTTQNSDDDDDDDDFALLAS